MTHTALVTGANRGIGLDVSDEQSVRACADALYAEGVRVDVVVNNAAVCPDGTCLTVGSETMTGAVSTNLLGPFWVSRAFAPIMIDEGYGRIVNVSSGWGTFAEGLGGPVAYSVTKAALNGLTMKLASDLAAAGSNIKVNAACPGWVKTRMGGLGATRSVAEGADTIVWLATLPDDGPTGTLFRDRSPIRW